MLLKPWSFRWVPISMQIGFRHRAPMTRTSFLMKNMLTVLIVYFYVGILRRKACDVIEHELLRKKEHWYPVKDNESKCIIIGMPSLCILDLYAHRVHGGA